MMRRSMGVLFAAAIAAIAVGGARLTAQASSPAPFRFERAVAAHAGGQRLPIDVTLLTGGNPFRIASSRRIGADVLRADDGFRADGGLSDLRFFDASGKEIGYLLITNPGAAPHWTSPIAVSATAPVETDSAKSTGFEADLGTLLSIDRVRVDGIPAPFMKRVHVEGSGDRSRWTVLVEEGTVFDLPDLQLSNPMLAFPPGSFRYVRVTWDDRRSARVQPTHVSVREVAPGQPVSPLTTPVVFERRPSEPRTSRFRFRLPAGRLPIAALELDVAGGRIMREAEIYEARLAGAEVAPALIGRGTIKRVEQDSVVASAMRLPVQQPVESELELVVNDDDNPPLELRGVTAVFAELPWIYLESDGSGLIARYGNPSLTPPKYDLEAARPGLDINQIAIGAWGEARERTPAENAGGVPPALPTVGARIDTTAFHFVRDVPAGDAGLIAIRLDAAVLAHSAGVANRFADVRVVDDRGRQIPYIVERVSEPLPIDLSLEKVSSPPPGLPGEDAPRSVYHVRFPYPGLPTPRLVLTTNARVFTRSVVVAAERPPDEHRRNRSVDLVGSGGWTHADQEHEAPALALALRPTDQTEAYVVVSEGDNTPLPILTARLLVPAYRIRLFREPNASLRLAYGKDDLTPPAYDLALLAPRMLGATAVEVILDAERESAGAGSATASLISPRIFWGILGFAVLALLVLIGRLLRQSTD